MAGCDSVAQRRQLACGDVEVGAADAAGFDLEEHFAGRGLGDGHIFEDQRARGDGSGMAKDGGSHLFLE
jgi:hypothetical protein